MAFLERTVHLSQGPMAVAVSGGSDSLALLLLAHRWGRCVGRPLVAFTVDHGLRPESTQEAQRVQTYASSLGIRHKILTWAPPQNLPLGHLERMAREARYSLLAEACWQHRCSVLLLGHTQEDQIETLLLRASHGSGAFGLAGMLPVRFLHPHLALVRPLLSFRRHILQAFLHQQGVRWISDPHNANRLFQRVQIRQALHQVDPRTYQDLCACSRFYAAERRLYARATQRFLQKNATLLGLKVHVDPKAFSLLSLPLRQYILRHILTCVGGKPYPPNEKALQRACTSIASTVSTRITLGRVLLEKRARFLVFSREQRNPPPPLRINPQGFACWDGRFWLENSTSSPCWIAPPMEEEERFPPGILQIVSSVENLFKN